MRKYIGILRCISRSYHVLPSWGTSKEDRNGKSALITSNLSRRVRITAIHVADFPRCRRKSLHLLILNKFYAFVRLFIIIIIIITLLRSRAERRIVTVATVIRIHPTDLTFWRTPRGHVTVNASRWNADRNHRNGDDTSAWRFNYTKSRNDRFVEENSPSSFHCAPIRRKVRDIDFYSVFFFF